MPDNQTAIPPGLLPLGYQANGSYVQGQSPDNHYNITGGFGNPVFNDSGIILDPTKFFAMPGAGQVGMIEVKSEVRDGELTESIVWDVPWSIRKAWLDWCFGYSMVITNAAGNWIQGPVNCGAGAGPPAVTEAAAHDAFVKLVPKPTIATAPPNAKTLVNL